MPEIIVVSIVFGSLLGALYLVLDHLKSRRVGSSDRSMTRAELSGLIDEAVDRATADLRRRIENLEAIATEESPRGHLLLDEHDEAEEIQIPEREASPRRARS